ncbi:hypothetical protein Plhal304r1_c006g0023071 [Plasmopara halstedii]
MQNVRRIMKILKLIYIKFSDFASKSMLSVIGIDDQFDLLLGYVWLEDHEPWTDWRAKQITRSSPGGNQTYGRQDPSVAITSIASLKSKLVLTMMVFAT